MSAGIIDQLKKYQWAEQKNGKLIIFNVPIFKTFGVNQWGHPAITEKDAQDIINSFEEDKILGHYPRVHLGHHRPMTMENRPGVGYLDDLRLENGVIFADLVEMKPEIFADKTEIRYPYRSAEYIRKLKKITTVALLESQPPFFIFPLLALESAPIELNEKQLFCCQQRITFFQEKNMPTVAKKAGPGGASEEIKEPAPEQAPASEKMPETSSSLDEEPRSGPVVNIHEAITIMGQQLARVLTLLEKKEKFQDVPDDPLDETSITPVTTGADASSVAFQLQLSDIRESLAKIQKEMYQMQGAKKDTQHQDRLIQIGQLNPNINLETARHTLEQFSDSNAKEIYLNSLATQTWGHHSAASYAENFSAQEINQFLEPYNKESSHIQKVAKKAYQEFFQLMTTPEGAKQLRLWQNPERFIAYVVEAEKNDVGAFDRMMK